MSTNPTDITEALTTGMQDSASIGIIGGADGPTAIFVATEGGSGLEGIKELMDAFDPASLLPDLSSVVGMVMTAARYAVLAGPIVLLAMGLAYLFLSPKEANYKFGYRCYFGMGSVESWRFTQRLAGIVWTVLGLVLTVVMVLVTGSYGGKEVIAVVDSAVTCLIWEIVLAAISCLVINLIVMLTFDRKGAPRKRNNKDAA